MNRAIKMKRTISLVMTMSVGFAFAADVTYTEPPADTAMIKVTGGTTTVAGLEAYSHLTHYWSFDDAENYLTDSTGTLTFGKMGSTTITHETAEGAKLGAGAVTVDAGLKVPKNVITSQTFTVAFWLRPNDKTNTGGGNPGTTTQGSIFYVGEECTKTVSDEKRLLLGYGNSNGKMFFWNTGNSKSEINHTTVPGVWEHWAITRDSENNVKVYLNGTSKSTTTYENVFGENDKLVFGNGWHYDGGTKPIGGGTFDEILIFDRDLTDDEIKAFANYSSPVDFSAGWDIAADGTLDIFGRKPLTALKGEGVAKTMETTRLEASSNAWFAGSVQSPAFTFAGESSVTQTLSGANAWTGATTVESGTLEIAASPVQIFGDALVAWYPFEDAANPGRDFSPRGNNLTVPTACKFDVSSDGGVGLGQAIFLTNNTTQTGLNSSSCLKGLTPGSDNSYTVSFWMRTDAWDENAGPFHFSTGKNSAASGLITKGSEKSIRYGDSGKACSATLPFTWGDKVWHHIAVVFDSEAAKQGQYCHYCFVDGACLNKSRDYNTGITNHAATVFYVGRGFSGGSPVFSGALDEVIVLNTADTNDVSKLYNFRRATVPAPREATGVLPTGTTLTVEEGATLKLTAANETVKRLYGKGTIDLSGNSTLTVTRRIDFEGNVIGGEITDGRPGIIMIVR